VSDIAISVDHVWKNFRLYHERNRYIKAAVLRGRRARYEEFWALKDVTFEVKHGATLGIIGSNGSGKSTMLKCLAGILFPNEGSVSVSGRLAALLELGAGFHPELTGRENVFLNGAILGMSRRDLELRFDQIVEFAGLERFIDTPVKNFSSGMTVRLGFAIAAHVEPEILLIDEVLSVGDQSFQRKSAEKIEEFRREGRTIVFVSHGMAQVQQLCKEIVWLEKGDVRGIGSAADIIAEYNGDSYGATESSSSVTGRRWGNGRARILGVDTFGEDGARKPLLHVGDPLKIQVTYESHVQIEDLVVFIRITTASGQEVWAASTRSSAVAIPWSRGQGRVSLRLHHLPLLEGTYKVSVALRNGREIVEFDHWEDAEQFDVHQISRFDSGLVALDATWKIES
jgi:ABC-type polysaccharide/polyol phosphate transport system ATPase subunit